MRVRVSSHGKVRVSTRHASYSNRGGARVHAGRTSVGKSGVRVSGSAGPFKGSVGATGARGAFSTGRGPFYGGGNASGPFWGVSAGLGVSAGGSHPTPSGYTRQGRKVFITRDNGSLAHVHTFSRSEVRRIERYERSGAAPLVDLFDRSTGAVERGIAKSWRWFRARPLWVQVVAWPFVGYFGFLALCLPFLLLAVIFGLH